MSRTPAQRARRAFNRKLKRDHATAEDFFIGSPEWTQVVDQCCQDQLGYSLKHFLSQHNQGQLDMTDPIVQDVIALCSPRWLKK